MEFAVVSVKCAHLPDSSKYQLIENMMFPHFKFLTIVIFFVVLGSSGCSTQSPAPTGKTPDKTDEKTASRQPEKSITKSSTATKSRKRVNKRIPSADRQGKVSLPSRSFTGTWVVSESSAEFTIKIKSGLVTLTGRDIEDNEDFRISRIRWNENNLFATVQMPSTNHVLKLKLTVLDNDKLQCNFSGDAIGLSTWKRKK